MSGEIDELWDAAIYKEIAAEAFYIAAQSKTEDPGARALMKELADGELKHSGLLKNLKETGWQTGAWHQEKVPDLMVSQYLTAPDSLEGAGLQETLIFAMKREQQSVEFYSRMMGLVSGEDAKNLCQRLVHEELRHKLKLELYYEDLFRGDD
jgi:rubrerythrin